MTSVREEPRTSRVRQRIPRIDPPTLRSDLRTVAGATVAVFLMIFWAVDDGGTDPQTWYWGALLLLACTAVMLVVTRRALLELSRPLKLALAGLALYTAWSYLSMTWAVYPGLALQGSNRTLSYLLIFSLMAILPWRARTALVALIIYASGVGTIAVALLFRFTLGTHISELFSEGKLVSPTGYFNSSAALFTIGALVAVALAARRDLPAPLRGLLSAFAAADVMLAVAVQSRGWLFTLPLVGLYAVCVLGDRLRCVAAVILPAAGALVAVHPLLRLYEVSRPAAFTDAAIHAGKIGLLSCAAVFAAATLVGWIETARGRPPLARAVRWILGTCAALAAVAGLLAGLLVVSGGHPAAFISRQWHGFAHEPSVTDAQTYFGQVGSGRYDIWRSALDAFRAHPIGGLGQDNFGDWYLTHRHTYEEPLWTHSLWLRLLAHTGIVGLLLIVLVLIAALVAALGHRRDLGPSERTLVGVALLPVGVWLIHGSIDWFWEVPALSGPALGFLAMGGRLRLSSARAAGALDTEQRSGRRWPDRRAPSLPAPVLWFLGGCSLVAATIALGLPYLAVRELDLGIAESHKDVSASLADFRASHHLDPLMSDPGTLGGAVALLNGRDATAAGLFRQAVSQEPGDWIAWLGRGLAASMQGQVEQARRSYRVALHLDADQVVVQNAWKRVGTQHPLAPREAFDEINYLP